MLSNPDLASKDDSTARLAYRWRGNVTQISEYSSGTSQYQCIVLQLQVHQKDQSSYNVCMPSDPDLASNDNFTTNFA
jgi:hypothetical protein